MNRRTTSLGLAGGSILAGLITERLADLGGLVFWACTAVALAAVAVGLLPWRQIWSVIRGTAEAGASPDAVSAAAEQAGRWLEALGTEGGGMIAARWFEENEPAMRALLDRADPAADQVDDLATIGDALEAWYVRQRLGSELLQLSERLATIGEQVHRPDLQQLAAVRAATAHRLLGDEAAAESRLAMAGGGRRHRVTSAVQARHRLEHGLLQLTRAARYAPGGDRDDAVRSARASFDSAASAVPRADLTADLAIHINLAVTYLYQHEPGHARHHLRLASARATAAHDASANAHVDELNGVAAWLEGNQRGAIGWWHKAELRYADLDEHIGQARCLQHRGAAELVGRRPAAALRLLESSAKLLGGTAGHGVLEDYLGQARAMLRPAGAPAVEPRAPSRQRDQLTWLRRARRRLRGLFRLDG